MQKPVPRTGGGDSRVARWARLPRSPSGEEAPTTPPKCNRQPLTGPAYKIPAFLTSTPYVVWAIADPCHLHIGLVIRCLAAFSSPKQFQRGRNRRAPTSGNPRSVARPGEGRNTESGQTGECQTLQCARMGWKQPAKPGQGFCYQSTPRRPQRAIRVLSLQLV